MCNYLETSTNQGSKVSLNSFMTICKSTFRDRNTCEKQTLEI